MNSFNPWEVDSLEAFSYLKCPECTYDTKNENNFKDHALETHPLSFEFFGKHFQEDELTLDDKTKSEIKIKEESVEINPDIDYEQENGNYDPYLQGES